MAKQIRQGTAVIKSRKSLREMSPFFQLEMLQLPSFPTPANNSLHAVPPPTKPDILAVRKASNPIALRYWQQCNPDARMEDASETKPPQKADHHNPTQIQPTADSQALPPWLQPDYPCAPPTQHSPVWSSSGSINNQHHYGLTDNSIYKTSQQARSSNGSTNNNQHNQHSQTGMSECNSYKNSQTNKQAWSSNISSDDNQHGLHDNNRYKNSQTSQRAISSNSSSMEGNNKSNHKNSQTGNLQTLNQSVTKPPQTSRRPARTGWRMAAASQSRSSSLPPWARAEPDSSSMSVMARWN